MRGGAVSGKKRAPHREPKAAALRKNPRGDKACSSQAGKEFPQNSKIRGKRFKGGYFKGDWEGRGRQASSKGAWATVTESKDTEGGRSVTKKR